MTRAQQTEPGGGIPKGAGIIDRVIYGKAGHPVFTLFFPNGAPDFKFGVITQAVPVRILIADHADHLVALLREFVDAAAGPPELLTRAAALLDAVEGRSNG